MEVTRGEPPKTFTSITIVIHDENEARVMWHKLNQGFRSDYIASYKDSLPAYFSAIGGGLWEAFTQAYRPDGV